MPRSLKRQKEYFGIREERAVVDYLLAKTQEEKDKIYDTFLRAPIQQMVESIIRRYNLYRKNIEFEELVNDTISNLLTKIEKFDHTSNFKAFSYFGTICKNYLICNIEKDAKVEKKSIAYEVISYELDDSEKLSYRIDTDEDNIDLKKRIIHVSQEINDLIEKSINDGETYKLSENEKKVGYSLIEILNNYEVYFEWGEGNKFNKNLFLNAMREMTGLNTKDIRLNMAKYKKLYNLNVESFLNQ